MDKSPILTDASGQVRAAMVLDAQTESPRVVMTDPEGRVRLRLELAGPNEDPRLVMVGTDGREWQVMSAKGIAIEQIDPTVE